MANPSPQLERPPQNDRNPWRVAAIVAICIALAALGLAFWALRQVARSPVGLEIRGAPPAAAKALLPDRLVLVPASFDELPGWSEDRFAEAIAALLASCKAGSRGDSGNPLVALLESSAAALKPMCEQAGAAAGADDARLRTLFTDIFSPYRVLNNDEPQGLFTGYYEPELRGARRRKAPFVHPLYLAPRDQQVIDLGEFKRDLAGRRIVGQVRGGRFRPYWDRAEIEGGALRGKGLEMLWVDDPVALFFLQIQGSGRVVLPNGELVRVGYSGQNGHDYTAIGKVLIERGELERERVSLQTIRAWLGAHPAEADDVMAQNRSYVFFRVLPGAPVGASGVELTPGRSLAIDPAFLPYGLPLWLDTTFPALSDEAGASSEEAKPLRRLVVGQDRGGAIRGPVRGDLFWGAGAEAESIAGRMKQRGRIWLLWPRAAPPPVI